MKNKKAILGALFTVPLLIVAAVILGLLLFGGAFFIWVMGKNIFATGGIVMIVFSFVIALKQGFTKYSVWFILGGAALILVSLVPQFTQLTIASVLG